MSILTTEWNWDTAREVWEEEKLIIAKNLLAEGSTPEFVHRITGLSMDEINKLNL
jgi:hypothetical protein